MGDEDQPGLFDEDGKAARDDGIERVSRDDFQAQVFGLVRKLPPDVEVTGEDIRMMATERGIEPHHWNAWGAVMMHMVRSKMIFKTGRWVPMQDKSSHARQTPVYRSKSEAKRIEIQKNGE